MAVQWPLKPGPYHEAFPTTERIGTDPAAGLAGVTPGDRSTEAHPAAIAHAAIANPSRRHIMRTPRPSTGFDVRAAAPAARLLRAGL